MEVSDCVMLVIAAIAIVAITISAMRDLISRAPVGTTLKRWLLRTLDAFFSAP